METFVAQLATPTLLGPVKTNRSKCGPFRSFKQRSGQQRCLPRLAAHRQDHALQHKHQQPPEEVIDGSTVANVDADQPFSQPRDDTAAASLLSGGSRGIISSRRGWLITAATGALLATAPAEQAAADTAVEIIGEKLVELAPITPLVPAAPPPAPPPPSTDGIRALRDPNIFRSPCVLC